VLVHPNFDPIAFSIGPLSVRWYGLMYLVGFGIAYTLGRVRIAKARPATISVTALDDLLFFCVLGVVIGGRLGYVLFYMPGHYAAHPLEALYVWHGGMSFHGGALGVTLAILLFTRARKIPLFAFSDIITAAIPIGLFFGRIANFINGELYGRPTDVAWAMVFPRDDDHLPRHPSQLYEAGLEGILLFIFLFIAVRRFHVLRKPGIESGLFLLGYGVCRIISEYFRQPDIQLGYLIGGTTMGQILSLPMIAFGIAFIWQARRAP